MRPRIKKYIPDKPTVIPSVGSNHVGYKMLKKYPNGIVFVGISFLTSNKMMLYILMRRCNKFLCNKGYSNLASIDADLCSP